MTHPLTVDCPHCDAGTVWRNKFGGNDPDVWATRCEYCDGTGIKQLWCEGWKCHAEAVEMFDDAPYCEACVAEQKADALQMGEDA